MADRKQRQILAICHATRVSVHVFMCTTWKQTRHQNTNLQLLSIRFQEHNTNKHVLISRTLIAHVTSFTPYAYCALSVPESILFSVAYAWNSSSPYRNRTPHVTDHNLKMASTNTMGCTRMGLTDSFTGLPAVQGYKHAIL